MFLAIALLAGVLAATIGAGYTVSRPLLDDGGVYAATTNSVIYVNAESRAIEAEARDLATGEKPIQTVTLADGRVAVVRKRDNRVWIIDGKTMTPQGEPIAPKETSRPEDEVVVVPAPDSGYVGSGDVVAQIGPDGKQKKPVTLPAKIVGPSVPDAVEGIWVLLKGGKVAHVVGDEVRPVSTDRPIKFLTVADGRPFGLTDNGDLLDVSAHPLRRVDTKPVPHSATVLLGSTKGAGRWILVLDRGQLVAVDARTGARRTFDDLPQEGVGQPVQVGDRVYVPDYANHLLHVRDVGSGRPLQEIRVPGEAKEFTLEVHGGRVWANDQFDRRMVVVGEDGGQALVDKGDGKTDTDKPGGPDESPEPPSENDEEPAGPPTESAGPPAESTKPAEPSGADPAPMVEVPAIEPGADIDEACDRIRAARLVCEPVSVGNDGRMNTVVADSPTAPPAGAQVPESSRVQVRHYGPTTVPQVVGQYTDTACGLITNANLNCVRQPLPGVAPRPEDLDVVKAQSATGNASTGSDVAVSYHNQATLGDYRNQPGDQACTAIEQAYHGITCNVVEGPSEATSNGVPAGHTFDQDPQPNAVVSAAEPERPGSVVTLTVVRGSPYRVPDVRGQTPDIACEMVKPLVCDRRADVLGRDQVILAQEPAPGTPVDGGSVVIHYPPAQSVPLSMCRRDNGDYVFRLLENCENGYTNERYVLGSGYSIDTPRSPGLVEPLYEHFCHGTKEECLGFTANHYYSRGGEINHNGWQVRPGPSVVGCAENGTGDGMARIWRLRYLKDGTYRYTVRQSNTYVHPTLGVPPDYTEFLGCVWP